MAAVRSKTSSFSRNLSGAPLAQTPGVKHGPNGVSFVSSGIPDLDKILGGGFPLGSLVLVMEDPEAPHHLPLLRTFMSQGLVHDQPLVYASPSKDPRAFLGTLPSPVSSKDEKGRNSDPEQEKGLRIAWQYKKYMGEQQQYPENQRHTTKEYCNEFDLLKPLERHLVTPQRVDCISIQDSPSLRDICDRCSSFLAQLPSHQSMSISLYRWEDNSIYTRISSHWGDGARAGRIAIQSLCAPQCGYSEMDWDMLSFIRSLKSMIRSSNAVAVVTFPPSLLSSSFSTRWQHMADTVLSVRAIPDEDKEMAKLLTGYQAMVGLLHVHKMAQINTQVPVILETTTFSIKLHRRRSLILERLNQAPVDGSSGSSHDGSVGCSGSSKDGTLDF